MQAHPSGTVTFLFTDIEGSTRQWETHGDDMPEALRLHDVVMRSTVEAFHGYVFSTAGDAFAAAFGRAREAVEAAVAIQRRLAKIQWAPVSMRVRMGLHTGEADERNGDYFGPSLNRAARVMAAAHGGQVLASGVTASLVGDRLPDRVLLVDLGEHRLKDLDAPEHIFQVTDAALDQQFPPLRVLDSVPNNLSLQYTRFIGRAREMEELTALVPGNRLVTLTGVGGVGKTRLALQLAAEVLHHYPDGVWFVELAGIRDASLVLKRVAVAMGVQEQADRALASTLVDYLRDRTVLVILDNCEHLIASVAADVELLLQSGQNVSVLATSREALRVAGETVWTVPPMALPEAGEEPEVKNEAMELFADRARLADRTFALSAENASACAEICRRLDGVPLAIELAAARVTVLSPREIVDRLGEGIAILAKSARTAIRRQQTLRATIAWSYNLLSREEQALLRSLAVFRGGFTLEAVEAIWSVEDAREEHALDLLEQLVDKSLVTAVPGARDRRFKLLEPIRAVAWELLEEARERDDILQRHRLLYLEWAHRQSRLLTTRDELNALEALEADHDNLRAVLERCFAKDDLKDALALAADLSFFWFVHSHFAESGAWYDRLLAERDRVDLRAQIKLLMGAGDFCVGTGDHAQATTRFTEAYHLAQQVGSARMEGWALFNLFNLAVYSMDFGRARTLGRQALERFTTAGDQHGMTFAVLEQLYAELGEHWATGSRGTPEALDLLNKLRPILDVARAHGERNVLGHALEGVGTASVMAHQYSDAANVFAEAVDAFHALGNQSCLAHCLDRVAWLAEETARPEDAVRLLAASDALRDRIGIAAPPAYARVRDEARALARAKLSAHDFVEADKDGCAMNRDTTVQLALQIAHSTR